MTPDAQPDATAATRSSPSPAAALPARAEPGRTELVQALADLSSRFAWDGRKLVITDEPTLRTLTDRTMSASTMQAMEGCPSRWAFEKLWPGDPDPFAATELGTGAHTVLERFYGLDQPDRTVEAAMTILRQVAQETVPGDSPLTSAVRDRWLAEVYSAFKGIFDIEDPTRIVVEGRELPVSADIGGVELVGFVDRLDRLDDGGLAVYDYKSSGQIPRNITQWGDPHGDQQRLYLMALEQMRGELPQAAYLHYIRLGQTKKVAQSRKRLSETRDRFLVAAERLHWSAETSMLSTVPSGLCGWCPLVNACPAARAEQKVDRTGHAVPAEWLPIPTIKPTGAVDTSELPRRPDKIITEDAPGVGVGGRAAHGTGAAPELQEAPSTSGGPQVSRLKEGQPYVELADGDLNPNSYAAMAAVDVVDLAMYTLDSAGVPLTRTGVTALADLYASIILDVQKPVTGQTSFQDGMNSRARFLVKRVVRTLPAPIDGGADAWTEWAARVVKRARLMWQVAYQLWTDGGDPDGTPATDLAVAIRSARAKSNSGSGPGNASSTEVSEPTPRNAVGAESADPAPNGSSETGDSNGESATGARQAGIADATDANDNSAAETAADDDIDDFLSDFGY